MIPCQVRFRIEPWADSPVSVENAIRGFYEVTLNSLDPKSAVAVLESLGYKRIAKEGDRTRYRTSGDRAAFVDVLDQPDAPRGRQGVGTVYHIAFRTADEQTQAEWREPLSEIGIHVTPQKDRQ